MEFPLEQKKQEEFDKQIHAKLGEASKESDFDKDSQAPLHETYKDDDDDLVQWAKDKDDEPTPITFDAYVGAEVVLLKGDKMVPGKVIGQKHDVEGNPIRKVNKNPTLDSRVYKVQFVDSGQAEFRANVMENMYVYGDIDGNQHILMDSIIDHNIDKTVMSKDNQFFMFNGT